MNDLSTIWLHLYRTSNNKPDLFWFIEKFKSANSEAITTLPEFHEFVTNYFKQKWRKSPTCKRTYRRLEELWELLSRKYWITTDPIYYFFKQYYIEELSLSDIFSRLDDISPGFYTNPESLWGLFTKTFKWKLRSNTEQTSMRVKKQKVKEKERQHKMDATNQRRKDEAEAKFKLWFIKNSSNTNKEDFQQDYYDSLKNKTERLKYLLKVMHWINEEWINSFSDYWLWTKVVARQLNKLLDEACEKLWVKKFTMNSWEIWEIIKNKDL